MDLNLQGKNAFVCGSTQGIGRAAAVELAKLGARVILIARNEAALISTRDWLDHSHGQQHEYICADFSDADSLKRKVEALLQKISPAHILVNNTGGPPAGEAIEAKTGEFLEAFSRHLICNQILTQALVPGMKEAGYGRIINIISTSVKQPIPGLGVSNTIRAAVANWAKTLSRELAPFGITVNNVLPGMTSTQRLFSLMETMAQKSAKTREEIKAEMIASIPAQRLAEASEIAHAIAFLATPAAGYINGINLPVDGGRTASL
jgi:3-oxoacyl-[acyl-carrier protein] reductase